MALKNQIGIEISEDLLQAIRSFPPEREVEHCGVHFSAPPFDLYAKCPRCGSRVKLRAFSACNEVEDVFDAVFEWMRQAGSQQIVSERIATLAEDE